MKAYSENQPDGKVKTGDIPTVDNTHSQAQRVGIVEANSINQETVTTRPSRLHSHTSESKEGYSPSLPNLDPVDHTHPQQQTVEVVEEHPIRRETVATKPSTSHSHLHSHSTKSKEDHGPSLPILGAIACCIPLAGILGYLIHQPGERVVTRTVTQTVPVLTVPAPPVTPQAPVSPAVTPPNRVGAAQVGPKVVGPARVGADHVGEK